MEDDVHPLAFFRQIVRLAPRTFPPVFALCVQIIVPFSGHFCWTALGCSEPVLCRLVCFLSEFHHLPNLENYSLFHISVADHHSLSFSFSVFVSDFTVSSGSLKLCCHPLFSTRVHHGCRVFRDERGACTDTFCSVECCGRSSRQSGVKFRSRLGPKLANCTETQLRKSITQKNGGNYADESHVKPACCMNFVYIEPSD